MDHPLAFKETGLDFCSSSPLRLISADESSGIGGWLDSGPYSWGELTHSHAALNPTQQVSCVNNTQILTRCQTPLRFDLWQLVIRGCRNAFGRQNLTHDSNTSAVDRVVLSSASRLWCYMPPPNLWSLRNTTTGSEPWIWVVALWKNLHINPLLALFSITFLLLPSVIATSKKIVLSINILIFYLKMLTLHPIFLKLKSITMLKAIAQRLPCCTLFYFCFKGKPYYQKWAC